MPEILKAPHRLPRRRFIQTAAAFPFGALMALQSSGVQAQGVEISKFQAGIRESARVYLKYPGSLATGLLNCPLPAGIFKAIDGTEELSWSLGDSSMICTLDDYYDDSYALSLRLHEQTTIDMSNPTRVWAAEDFGQVLTPRDLIMTSLTPDQNASHNLQVAWEDWRFTGIRWNLKDQPFERPYRL